MPLNLHLLRLFAAVVDAGSFSKAAKVLGISQPSVSKGVRDFELQLGCRLLDRSARAVVPTREGTALMQHAEVVFSAERAAEQELKSLRTLESGSLRIGGSTTIATYLLPDFLGRFHASYPGIDLYLISANTRDIAEHMLRNELEVALVEGPVEIEGLKSEPWQVDVMDVIVGPNHRFASSSEPIDPIDFARELLVVREPGSGTREVVMQSLETLGVNSPGTLEIGSTEAIKQAVAAGLGVSIVSRASVTDQILLGKLRTINVRGLRIERTLWKLQLRGRLDIPAAIAFDRLIAPGTKAERTKKSA